jgi:hypothetical protein
LNRRFWVSYAAALVVFASLSSLASSFTYLVEGARLGADGRILASLVRSSAPMAAGSALLLALALWIEALPSASLARQLDPGLRRALSLALPGYLSSAAIAFGACAAVSAAATGLRPSGFGAWLGGLTREDGAAGLAFTLLDTALILLLARRYAVRLRAMPISLPAKLILIVTVTVPLRATLALIFAPFLPG